MPLTKIVLYLAVILAWPAAASAQDAPCGRCKGQFTYPCPGKAHDPKRTCGTSIKHTCETLLNAACCQGRGVLPCPKCKDPVAESAAEEEIARRSQWARQMSKHDMDAGFDLVQVESLNFMTHCSIRTWSINSKPADQARAAHFFAERLETVADRFKGLVGRLPEQRSVHYFVGSGAECSRIAYYKLGRNQDRNVRHYDSPCLMVSWPDPQLGLSEDEGFRAHTIHVAAHSLIQTVVGFNPKFPTWFDEGFAHWVQRDLLKSVQNVCFDEVRSGESWIGGDWAKKVRSELGGKKLRPLPELLGLGFEKFKAQDFVHSWSVVDHLIRRDAEAFKKFVVALKRTNDAAAAIQEVYGQKLSDFEEGWRIYAQKQAK